MENHEIKKAVRENYARIAQKGSSCCSGNSSTCGSASDATAIASGIGYSNEEMASIPRDANLGLGCGNPTAMAALQQGQVVLDLGSGAGIDCFLAAKKVGKE